MSCVDFVTGDGLDGEKGVSVDESVDSLPLELPTLVHEDNEKFVKEMEDWDLEQRRKSTRAAATGSEGDCNTGECSEGDHNTGQWDQRVTTTQELNLDVHSS